MSRSFDPCSINAGCRYVPNLCRVMCPRLIPVAGVENGLLCSAEADLCAQGNGGR